MEPKRGPLTRLEFERSAAWIATQQLPSGEIPWQRGGKSDPWDMVHAAMGLAVAGRHAESTAAYRFLARTQNEDGSWPGEWRGEAVSNATRETNHAAYVATGVWHQFCAKPDADLLAELWPMVSKAIDFVVRHQLPCGGIAWALDPQGRPWSERKAVVWWDAEHNEWTGHDVPDFEKNKAPDYRPPDGAVGVEALRGDDPFIMQADGKGWLFAPDGVQDGPMPTHYEPHESPVRNALYAQQGNPARKVYGRADNPSNPSPPEAHGEVFPFVFTAARLTEHHTAGGMSRQLPYLAELQPELFVEVSPELAEIRGLAHMDWAHVVTSRAAVDARVFVTSRMRPLRVEDHVVHQIWMPYHWGNKGLVDGDVVNDLLGVVADPNVFIQESKVATCDIQPGRRPRGAALLEYLHQYRNRAQITAETGTDLDTTQPSRDHTEER